MLGSIIDIETTGFSKDTDNVVEVGIIRFDTDTWKIISDHNLFFWKEGYDADKTTHIHGLTNDFLRKYYEEHKETKTGLSLFDENMVTLVSALFGCVFIGKNSNAFDIPFLGKWIYRASDGMFEIGKWRSGIPVDMQVEFAPKYQIVANTSKKGTLSQYIDIIPRGWELVNDTYSRLSTGRDARAHNALYDCAMTYVVYCYWKKPWK